MSHFSKRMININQKGIFFKEKYIGKRITMLDSKKVDSFDDN